MKSIQLYFYWLPVLFLGLFLLMEPIALGDSGKAPAAKEEAKAKPEPPPDPAVVAELEAVRKYYREAGDFSAGFKQEYHSKITRRIKESGGMLDFARPSKMRWEYEKPERKSFISDGKRIWLVRWEEKEVLIRDLRESELEASLAFLWGGGNLVEDYAVAKLPDGKIEDKIEVNGRIVLELLPKKPAQYAALYLLIDPARHRIEEVVLVDAIGNLNHLTFTEPKNERKFKKGHFRFKAPKGWSVEKLDY